MRDDPRADPLPSIAPRELAERRAHDPAACVLLDVREAFELDLAALPGALHIPLRELPLRAAEVPRDRPVVVMCHHGVRSAWAARFLREQGVEAHNLRGGIDAYARDVDPSVGSY